MASEICTVGAMLRPSFRQLCAMLGCTYREEKGFLDSVFVVTGSDRAMEALRRKVTEIMLEDAREERQRADEEQARRDARHAKRWWKFWRWGRA